MVQAVEWGRLCAPCPQSTRIIGTLPSLSKVKRKNDTDFSFKEGIGQLVLSLVL